MNLSNQLSNSMSEISEKTYSEKEEQRSVSGKYRNDKFWMKRKNKNRMKRKSRKRNRK